eukprot:56619_1
MLIKQINVYMYVYNRVNSVYTFLASSFIMSDSRSFNFFIEHEKKKDQSVSDPSCGIPKIILGAIPFGGSLNSSDTARVINEFINDLGERNIDGAYLYGNEETVSTKIASISNAIKKAQISTKVTPMFADNNPDHPFGAFPYPSKKYLGLTPESIRKQVNISLNKLQRDSVDVLYLHWMDITTDINITLRTINDLYQQGKFHRFGLSNFYSWQVAQIYTICKQNNYILPTVYQGHYNPICRDVETELMPCLRYFGIDFYAFGILANGLLAGGYYKDYKEFDEKTSGHRMGVYFSNQLYWRKSYFEAFKIIKETADKLYGINNVNYSDLTMRWMAHHSYLGSNDGIVCGISKYKYFKQTINSIKYGKPLEKEMLKAFDEAWNIAKKETRGYLQWNTQYGIIRTDDPFIQKGLRCRL